MKTYTTQYESWLSQLYYYLITSIPMGDEFQSYHDLPKDDWWEYYDMGLTARDAVKGKTADEVWRDAVMRKG